MSNTPRRDPGLRRFSCLREQCGPACAEQNHYCKPSGHDADSGDPLASICGVNETRAAALDNRAVTVLPEVGDPYQSHERSLIKRGF